MSEMKLDVLMLIDITTDREPVIVKQNKGIIAFLQEKNEKTLSIVEKLFYPSGATICQVFEIK